MRAGIEPRTARWMAIRIGVVAFAFAVGFVGIIANHLRPVKVEAKVEVEVEVEAEGSAQD